VLVKFKAKAYLDRLYKPSSTPQEVPEEFRDRLPSSAKVVEDIESKVAELLREEPVALSSLNKKTAPKVNPRTFSDLSKGDPLDD